MTNFGDWKDVVLLAVGFVLSVAAGLLGAYLQRLVDRRAERRPLSQLLNFGPEIVLLVFPPRDESPEAILPRTSTEDFLAMNNFISTLLNMGWSRKVGIRDTTRLTEADKRRNLVVICSPKSNTFADELQKELRRLYPNAFTFVPGPEVCIRDGDGAEIHSKSYKQIRDQLAAGVAKSELPAKAYEDYAIVSKVTSPWNNKAKVVWVAGIRGIGTWGAAECIKKEWQQIYDRLPEGQKEADFSALVRVQYDNSDITSVEVRRVELLRGATA
jgi:hypothetical protein